MILTNIYFDTAACYPKDSTTQVNGYNNDDANIVTVSKGLPLKILPYTQLF
jgi:hypothetical protein